MRLCYHIKLCCIMLCDIYIYIDTILYSLSKLIHTGVELGFGEVWSVGI